METEKQDPKDPWLPRPLSTAGLCYCQVCPAQSRGQQVSPHLPMVEKQWSLWTQPVPCLQSWHWDSASALLPLLSLPTTLVLI